MALVGSIGAIILIGVIVTLPGILGTIPTQSTNGPLRSVNTISVHSPLAADQTATWGEILPQNPTDTPIKIEAIDPINPRGLDVVGIRTNNPDVEGGMGFTRTFPPPGMTLGPVAGAILSPSTSASLNLQILIGVRLSTSSTDGTIDGRRVRYELGGRTYELVVPGSLTLTLAPSSPSP